MKQLCFHNTGVGTELLLISLILTLDLLFHNLIIITLICMSLIGLLHEVVEKCCLFYDVGKLVRKMRIHKNTCRWNYVSEKNYKCECLVGYIKYFSYKSKYDNVNFIGVKKNY